MNSAQIQALILLVERATEALDYMRKRGPMVSPRNNIAFRNLGNIRDTLKLMLDSVNYFEEKVTCSTCNDVTPLAGAPLCPNCGSRGTLTIPRPFGDVMEGFNHAMAIRGTNLKTGFRTTAVVLTKDKFPPVNGLSDLLDAMLRRGANEEIGWEVTNRATVVPRSKEKEKV